MSMGLNLILKRKNSMIKGVTVINPSTRHVKDKPEVKTETGEV
jgi:hypothetical protein